VHFPSGRTKLCLTKQENTFGDHELVCDPIGLNNHYKKYEKMLPANLLQLVKDGNAIFQREVDGKKWLLVLPYNDVEVIV
jgi:hypothetical protein